MLKKLYFHLSDTRTHVFDIKRTVRVDEGDFTKWIVSVDPQNELGICEVVATTDDCIIDTIGGESLVAIKITPPEKVIPIEAEEDELEVTTGDGHPPVWTVHIETPTGKTWSTEGEMAWTEQGHMTVKGTQPLSRTVYLSKDVREFDIDKRNHVINARLKK